MIPFKSISLLKHMYSVYHSIEVNIYYNVLFFLFQVPLVLSMKKCILKRENVLQMI